MFLRVNEKIINLKNVSNINVLKDSKRIIFNMNYFIKISTNKGIKQISDYIYWDADKSEEFISNLSQIKSSEYFIDNFKINIKGNKFLNINEISSVKFIPEKNRIIFNMAHPITFNSDKITSEFIFVNCSSEEEYNKFEEYVNTIIGG